MLPSPSLRHSPRMEIHGDSHRRGRSLECGLSFKEKDDDLILFNEMQSRENKNFLLQPTDDIEEIFSSAVKPFPDVKLGINIPARGESSDLLNADGNKNDYEWLLTPPDTPLFPSLDDEPAPPNLVQSRRDRSRPISISRSSTMERNHSSRGSPSPQRLNRSPRSGSGAFCGRPSSAPHSSPVPLRPSSPSRRPSPPPVKPSTPPRSSTPTSQRSSVGSPGSRGASPVRTSRGNSASPKIKAWQSNIPGFSLEAPPNLCTSLADRPASYVRGSSPASRAGGNSYSKFGRRSMSPTASRSISSSHSQERDRLSLHSRGSLASSGDDDADSVQSVPVSAPACTMSRKGFGGFRGSKSLAFSKKPMKTLSANSASKRCFDSAMRQMDRKGAQNMFRPLLSSVPSSNFYAGKTGTVHRSMISKNSSVATSSDTEGRDQYQDDMASECAMTPYSDIQDEVFGFDKTDVASDETGLHALSEVELHEPDKTCGFVSNAADVRNDFVKIESLGNSLVCSRCGCQYHPDELPESENNICSECKQKERIFMNPASVTSSETTPDSMVHLVNASEESNGMDPLLVMPQSQIVVGTDDPKSISDNTLQEGVTREVKVPDIQPSDSCLEQNLPILSEQQVTKENQTVDKPTRAANGSVDMQKCVKNPEKIDDAEGARISVLLLKRSSSAEGPLIYGRTLNRSAISYDDLSYTRDLTSSTISSIGHGSTSTLTSVDLSSTRHGEIHVQRHLSGRRSDTSSKPQSTVSSLSGSSMQVYRGLSLSTGSHEENYEGSLSNMHDVFAAELPCSPSNHVAILEKAELSISKTVLSEENNCHVYVSPVENDSSVMDQHPACTVLKDNSSAPIVVDGHLLREVDEDNQKSMGIVQNVEESAFPESSVAEESTRSDSGVKQVEREGPAQCSLSIVSEIEIDDSHHRSPRSQIDMLSKQDLEDHPTYVDPSKDVKALSLESSASDHVDGLVEESTVTVEERGGRTRSLTLEEATDTILFCSSIVHDLAYKAASIAIEKEKENLEPFEVLRPIVTIPERREDFGGVTTGRSVKAQKARKRHTDPELKSKPPLSENDNRPHEPEPVVRNVGFPKNADSMKPPKLESKCNCTIM